MYIYIYIYIYTYIYNLIITIICVYIYIYMYIYIYVYVCIYIYIYIHIHCVDAFLRASFAYGEFAAGADLPDGLDLAFAMLPKIRNYVYIYIYVCVYIYIYIEREVCMIMCIYIYIYICWIVIYYICCIYREREREREILDCSILYLLYRCEMPAATTSRLRCYRINFSTPCTTASFCKLLFCYKLLCLRGISSRKHIAK